MSSSTPWTTDLTVLFRLEWGTQKADKKTGINGKNFPKNIVLVGLLLFLQNNTIMGILASGTSPLPFNDACTVLRSFALLLLWR